MLAGLLVMMAGAAFNSLIVSVITKRFEVLVGLVPVISCLVVFQYLSDREAGVAFNALDFVKSIFLNWASLWGVSVVVVYQVFPAVLVSVVIMAIKRRPG